MPSTAPQSRVWTPCPDCAPFHVRCSADALTLAVAWPELPEFGVLLALLDADERIERLVTNPTPEQVFAPELVARSGSERPVHGVALFTVTEPGHRVDVSSAFVSLHDHYAAIGIRFVDWVQIDADDRLYRSVRLNAIELHEMTVDYLRAGTCA